MMGELFYKGDWCNRDDTIVLQRQGAATEQLGPRAGREAWREGH